MGNIAIAMGALTDGIVGDSLFAAGLVARPPTMNPAMGMVQSGGQMAGIAPDAHGMMTGPGGPAMPRLEMPKPGAAITVAGPDTQQVPQAKTPASAEGLAPLAQPLVAAPITRREPALVKYEVETHEVTALMDDGVSYTYWTFGNTVPGPMLRVRQGDTVELTLKSPDSKVSHSIDLHAVTGPGGGAKATQLAPGESATFTFKALNPGVYVYHCATALVPHHIASGMIQHDLAFPTMKADKPAASLKVVANPGQTVTLKLTPTAAGSFEYDCTVPGHKEAGMKGKIDVAP